MPVLNPNHPLLPGATPQQLDILNQVTGSNAYLANALAGGGSISGVNNNPTANFWSNFWTNNPAPNDPLVTGIYDLGKTVDSLLGDPLTGSTFLGGNTNQGGLFSQLAGFFAFISDIQRVGTFLLALILIAAGLYALSKGPLIEVSASALRKAATS